MAGKINLLAAVVFSISVVLVVNAGGQDAITTSSQNNGFNTTAYYDAETANNNILSMPDTGTEKKENAVTATFGVYLQIV